jgi:hypothetical protein
MALFASGAIVRNHSESFFSSTVEGLDDIERLYLIDMDRTADDAYSVSNAVVDGDTVTFSYLRRAEDGTCQSGDGVDMLVEDGRIAVLSFDTIRTTPCP